MKTISNSKWVAAAMAGVLSTLATFAQVNRTIGTLPPGGSVTITFDVTINGNFPANTASVTNQANLTGTGFVVFTDDPLTFAANDPTVTAVTVAPQISCPPNITTNGYGACLLPMVSFGASVTAGIPAPTLTYKLGTTVISSPYAFPVGTNTVSVTATNGTTPNALCSFTVTVLDNPPQLNIARSGTNVVLSWPTNYTCYALQVSPALLLPPATNVWSPHPGPFTTINGNIYVTNGLTTTNRFFRLAH